jgi:hypothetical protein
MPVKKRVAKRVEPLVAACFNCKFSVAYETLHGSDGASLTEMYLCRRYPPTALSDGAEYPVVGSDFWCGEHRYGDSQSPHNA